MNTGSGDFKKAIGARIDGIGRDQASSALALDALRYALINLCLATEQATSRSLPEALGQLYRRETCPMGIPVGWNTAATVGQYKAGRPYA
jgi:hypothetical protein